MKDETIAKFTEAVPDMMISEPKLYQILVSSVKGRLTSRHTCEINTLNKHTIEFRMGKGSLCPERVAAVNEFVLLFCLWTMKVRVGKDCNLAAFEQFMKENVREQLASSFLISILLPLTVSAKEVPPILEETIDAPIRRICNIPTRFSK